KPRAKVVQIAAILIAAIVGVFIFASKVGAQQGKPAPAARFVPTPTVSASADPDASDAGAADDSGPGSPLDDTVVQTEDDIPKGLSEEQKSALGTGKVPIHREGKFASPFANPKYGDPAHVKVGLVINEIREYNIQTGGYDLEFFLSLTSDK